MYHYGHVNEIVLRVLSVVNKLQRSFQLHLLPGGEVHYSSVYLHVFLMPSDLPNNVNLKTQDKYSNVLFYVLLCFPGGSSVYLTELSVHKISRWCHCLFSHCDW